MKRFLVDYSLIGHGRKFALTLLRREREGLEVGTRVEGVMWSPMCSRAIHSSGQLRPGVWPLYAANRGARA
jgi:hypothetical protein